ncbi:rhomboid family intramembrane serine protease [Subtercola vilae]|uniref:Rhomboid family intramembrane serine protease n=1 Tax=Subtercola vilae TaxID=2056433 RepID=A0A4T2CF83_9MICO|nr:rhomboid family intramembrane serine protease [Subtercola vilae]TIH40858.1 rhomboid family intramembrane serine protease [Subtercola vilae]
MSTIPETDANFCYRHPNRQSYILCQRCGKTVCPECSVQAAVGVHCVDCAREGRRSQEYNKRPALIRAARATSRSSNAPVATYSLIGLTVFVYVLQLIPGLGVTNALQYAGAYSQPLFGIGVEPWRMLTYAFVHNPFTISSPFSLLHILLNMYSLYIFGRILEPMIGRLRFLALYLLAAVGGAVAMDVLATAGQPVIGASGAIFGLMGAFFIISRTLGGNMQQLVVLLVLNLAIGFLVPGIAWQVHVGGLVVGGLVGFIYMKTRRPQQQPVQIFASAAVLVLLVIVTVARSFY